MCETCGCGDPHMVSVEIQERILSVNDRARRPQPGALRGARRAGHQSDGIAGIGQDRRPRSDGAGPSPGAAASAAIAGDLETERDAERLRAAGIPARAITTGSACHLDASMVHHALHHDSLHDARLLFIENVGNLVCPAVYDLGQAFNVVALAVTEGEDKPLKYPVMFRKADLVLVTKTDLLPYLDVRTRGDRRRARSRHAGAGGVSRVGQDRRRPRPVVRLAGAAADGESRTGIGPPGPRTPPRLTGPTARKRTLSCRNPGTSLASLKRQGTKDSCDKQLRRKAILAVPLLCIPRVEDRAGLSCGPADAPALLAGPPMESRRPPSRFR